MGRLACKMCDYNFMGSGFYVILVGIIGSVITISDVIRLMNSTSATPQNRYPSFAVPIQVERDLKLMTSILGLEHYMFLVIAIVTEYPMLHVPWLLMQLVIIGAELFVFFVRVFIEGLHVTRDEIVFSLITLHNWLQVFCLFQWQTQSRVF
ncbi:uncharacterized protein LOC106656848 [Trichogramma pretiosum]|uniref:uncharacterized protein LOC106656848 n=1 Tax=Trichogramma pretiosum TaxID=7493 RepID=UPI000C71C912|nr:uncharacterized protein LOC106656848 [Trichogramma pretiosum]